MTAQAAAEKKKKRDEMFYRFYTSRAMGSIKNRLRQYDKAVGFYTSAIEDAEPGREIPLIIGRSKAQTRLVNHDAAREDALLAIEKDPENILTLENDAFTLYEKDDFEDALVRNYRGFSRRKKPDYFYNGILVGKETIEDCIGHNAGPCLDQSVVEMQLKPRISNTYSDSLAVAKRNYEREKIDQILAQTYLGRLAADKKFLLDMLKLRHLKSGNKEHNQQLELLISGMIDKINRNQETLMTQRPMYMLKYHKPKFSKKFEDQRHKEEERWRKGAMDIINRLLNDCEQLREERDANGCVSMCDRLRRFVGCQPSQLLSEKEREDILDELYTILGTLYMDIMTFIPTWSNRDNERRIEFLLHSSINDTSFRDKVKKTCFPDILNVKQFKLDLETKLSGSKHLLENVYLKNEIGRCLLEQGITETAYKSASAGYKLAKSDNNSIWAFNTGFTTSLSVLMEGSIDDAKIGFTEMTINARKLGRDDCSVFVQKMIKIAMEPDRLDFDMPDLLKHREKTIMNMMPTPELKIKAYTTIQKVKHAPRHSKLQLQPRTGAKRTQHSRRSMKILSQTKRRSLSVVKMNRPEIQKSLWKLSIEDDEDDY